MTGRPVSQEKEFEFVSRQVVENNARIMDAFKLYVQVMSAIVGGAIYLSATQRDPTKAARYADLSNLLVALITIVIVAMIIEGLRSWRGYRRAQSRLGGLNPATGQPYIPPPRFFLASLSETVMIIAMIAFATLFWRFNPFFL